MIIRKAKMFAAHQCFLHNIFRIEKVRKQKAASISTNLASFFLIRHRWVAKVDGTYQNQKDDVTVVKRIGVVCFPIIPVYIDKLPELPIFIAISSRFLQFMPEEMQHYICYFPQMYAMFMYVRIQLSPTC